LTKNEQKSEQKFGTNLTEIDKKYQENKIDQNLTTVILVIFKHEIFKTNRKNETNLIYAIENISTGHRLTVAENGAVVLQVKNSLLDNII